LIENIFYNFLTLFFITRSYGLEFLNVDALSTIPIGFVTKKMRILNNSKSTKEN